MVDSALHDPNSKPSDLITQHQAAKLVGRSVDTIRRWRRERGLEVWRDAHPTAPTCVSKAQVLALAGHMSPSGRAGEGAGIHASMETSNDALLAQRDHIATLQALVDSLTAQRDGLVDKVAQQRVDARAKEVENNHALTNLANKCRDLQGRIDALERELGNPVRALLGSGRRIWGR